MNKADERIGIIKDKCNVFFKEYNVRYTCEQYDGRTDRVRIIVICETDKNFYLNSEQIQELCDCGLIEMKICNTISKKFKKIVGIEVMLVFL